MIDATPVRTGNPGVVPPWLLPKRPIVAPGLVAPTPAPSPAIVDAAPVAVRDAVQGSKALDAIGYIPLPDGRIIVVEIPDDHFGGDSGETSHDHFGGDESAGRRESFAPREQRQFTGDVAKEQQRVEGLVDEVRAYFTSIGVKDSEGNDRTHVRFNPRYPNASYAPNGIPERKVPADSITVGVDPRSGQSFASAKDVVAHEWAHRVVDHIAELDMSPASEDVAVHESLADTFAAAYDSDDWIIGDGLVKPVRVMNDPEQLGHPDHVEDLKRVLASGGEHMHKVQTRSGDVVELPDWHVVAGIPNKAASLIGDALGRPTMAKIYLKAVRDYVKPGQEIEGLAVAVMQSTKDLFGAQSRELKVTQDAWDAVGVLDLVRKQQAAGTR